METCHSWRHYRGCVRFGCEIVALTGPELASSSSAGRDHRAGVSRHCCASETTIPTRVGLESRRPYAVEPSRELFGYGRRHPVGRVRVVILHADRGVNTRVGTSPTSAPNTVSVNLSDGRGFVGTMPHWNHFGRSSNTNTIIGTRSRRTPSCIPQLMRGWCDTTNTDGTPRSATSARSPTRTPSHRPSRPDQHQPDLPTSKRDQLSTTTGEPQPVRPVDRECFGGVVAAGGKRDCLRVWSSASACR